MQNFIYSFLFYGNTQKLFIFLESWRIWPGCQDIRFFAEHTLKIGKAQNILYFYFGLIEEAIEFSDLFFNTGKQAESSECYIYTSKLDFMKLIHDLAKLEKDGGGMESGCVASGI